LGERRVTDDIGEQVSLRQFDISDRTSDRVSAIVQLASSLGLSAVAEGLETSKQLEELRRLGCRYGQGYLFSAPMEADEIERLLRRSAPTVPFLTRR